MGEPLTRVAGGGTPGPDSPRLCGLSHGASAPWAGQPQWHVLDGCFDLGHQFLTTWLAWRQSDHRPARLHYSAITPNPPDLRLLLDQAQLCAAWAPLLAELAPHWFGLVTGTHRIGLDQGRVLLTLHVGELEATLPTLDVAVDSVFLTSPASAGCPPTSAPPWLKAVGRLCRRGTRLAMSGATAADRAAMVSAGFRLTAEPLAPTPNEDPHPSTAGYATYDPRWTPVASTRTAWPTERRRAVVVGAGLAGSAVAYSLALRGWSVDVLDAAPTPAAGASALPVGLVAPHVSPDDALLSRLSRAGVRLTLQRAQAILTQGADWDLTGVLEHRVEGRRGLPRTDSWKRWGPNWSQPATQAQQQACGLEGCDTLWHAHAGWIRPAQLVRAQLNHPAIRWHAASNADALHPMADDDWAVLGEQGQVLASAPLVVLATAWNTRRLLGPLLPRPVPLNPLRGQVCWGAMAALDETTIAALPPFPVNGHGALVHGFTGPDGQPAWVVGSTFERSMPDPVIRTEDRLANLQKLQGLLPQAARHLGTHFADAQDWAAVRCTLPDRVPAVGMLDPVGLPGLAVCTGMGARGLTLSVLCGEWLASAVQAEPWPLERKLADAINAIRLTR